MLYFFELAVLLSLPDQKPIPYADPDYHLLYFPGQAFCKPFHDAIREDQEKLKSAKELIFFRISQVITSVQLFAQNSIKADLRSLPITGKFFYLSYLPQQLPK